MYLTKLEDLSKDKAEFKKLIIKTYKQFGIYEALRILKKSGICINPFGTGKPKEKELFNEIMSFLDDQKIESEALKRFREEVDTINNIYKEFSHKFLRRIETSVPDDIQVSSYLIALEIFLTDFQNNMMSGFHSKVSRLNDNRADMYENIIQSTGVVLKYFIYKQYPFNGISRRIERQYIIDSTDHINGSQIREILDTIMDLWSYFDSDIKKTPENIVEITAIGDQALGKLVSHLSFMDIRNAKMSRHGYEELFFKTDYNLTDKLPPEQYISLNERTACEFIKEYFSTADLSIEFNGVTLAEMVRAYSMVSLECEKFLKHRKAIPNNFSEISLNDICIAKSKYKWINIFADVGIRKSKAEKILNIMTFDKNSNDIFDCPFIKMGNDYVVIPTASFITDSSRAILLNFNSKEISVSVKGTEFEKLIRQSIINSNLKCINLDQKDYECDAVFAIDNDLFFVESKNLRYPTTYREYARSLDEIHEACIQLERIVEHYTKESNIIEIKRRLEIGRINTITKIVVTNTSQGEKLIVNGTYVVDDTIFVGYFERRSPQIVEINRNVIASLPMFEKYYSGSVSKEQLIELIETSPLIEQNKKRIGYHAFDFSIVLGFILHDYFVKVNTLVAPDLLTKTELDEFYRVYGLKD